MQMILKRCAENTESQNRWERKLRFAEARNPEGRGSAGYVTCPAAAALSGGPGPPGIPTISTTPRKRRGQRARRRERGREARKAEEKRSKKEGMCPTHDWQDCS